MASILKRVLYPAKQSFWRGVTAGLLSHYVAVIVLLPLLVLVKPFLWTLVFGSPHWASEGPVDPNSGEGTLLQIFGALTWLPSGAAAMRWGGNRGVQAVLALFAYLAAISVFSMLAGTVPTMPVGRAIWYWMSGPIGIAIGVIASLKRHTKAVSP